jgi:prophage tail gpP-like protein
MYKVIVKAAAPGEEFQKLVWRKIKVKKSLDEICHYMELELPTSERNKIHKHDKVEIRLHSRYVTPNDNPDGTKRLTTVMVDAITDVTDVAQKGLLVIGRSPARDIIDSAWSGIILRPQNLEYITKKVAERFGIKVQRMPTNAPETKPVFSFSWESESPWQKLIAEADNQHYIFTSNEEGNLYLWKVAIAERDEGFTLDETSNIRNIQATENGAEQFHEYEVKGGGHTPARQIDDTCKNNRILTINLTDPSVSEDTLRLRALAELRRRREKRVTVTVSGWGLSEDRIKAWGDTLGKEIFWSPNFLIPVNIPSIGLDASLLISEAEYQADASSMTTAITLVSREAYT